MQIGLFLTCEEKNVPPLADDEKTAFHVQTSEEQ